MPAAAMVPRSALLVSLLGAFSGACGGSDAAPAAAPPVAPAVAVTPAPAPPPSRFDYPPARRDAVSETMFGTKVDDPYRWLEDGKSPEVKSWVDAESAYAHARLAALPRRDSFAARLNELLYAPAHGVPRHRGSRLFYSRKDAHQEKAVIYWAELGADGKPGAEKVLLDPNTWSADGSLSLHNWSVSWDGKKVAYDVHKNNADDAILEVLDVESGKKSEVDVIPDTKFVPPSWNARSDAFVYTRVPHEVNGKTIPEEERHGYAEIRMHVLGTPSAKDELVHEKTGDPSVFLGAYISEDGHWMFFIVDRGASKQDVYFRDLRTPASARAPFKPLVVGHEAFFNVEEYKDRFYVHTNDGAPHGKVVVADPASPDPASWKPLIPERRDQTLNETSIVGGKLSLSYLKDVVARVELHRLDGALEEEIELPGLGAAGALIGRQNDAVGYFFYESYTYPQEIFRYDVKAKKESSFFRQKLPLDPDAYVAEQGFAPSKDGTRVPVFVVHRKDVQKNSGRPLPTIQYGYGGFDAAETPAFRPSAIPWLDAGGVYAFTNLRGGSEYGEEWHVHGMRHEKQHVFDDAIGVAEWLIKEGWTDSAHLAALGGSNGGLLVGALVTERPDLFAVGLCAVPLLDMLRYDRFGAGKFWVDEYGSADKADDFPFLYAYSPYHHVKPGTRYPALLLLSADSDDRVDPLHARKFAARMQASSAGGPVLLRIEKNSGHGGADTTKSRIAQVADEYAFALANMPKTP
jgi:prolyl oligopeptidase